MLSLNAHLFLGRKVRLTEGSHCMNFWEEKAPCLACEPLGRKTDGSSNEISWTFVRSFGETSRKAHLLGAFEMGLDGMFFSAQSLEKSAGCD